MAVDDEHGDTEEYGDEGDAEEDYEEQEEEVFYAGQSGNFRGRGLWPRGRGRYSSCFGQRGYANANPTRINNRRLNNEPLRGTIHLSLFQQGRLPTPVHRPTINHSNLLTGILIQDAIIAMR